MFDNNSFLFTVKLILNRIGGILCGALLSLTRWLFREKKNREVVLIARYASTGGLLTYHDQLINYFSSHNISFVDIFPLKNKDILKNIFERCYSLENFRAFIELLYLIRIFYIYRPSLIVICDADYRFFVNAFLIDCPVIQILHSYPFSPSPLYYSRIYQSRLTTNKRVITVSNYAKEQFIKYVLQQSETTERFIHVIHNTATLEIKDRLYVPTPGKEITVLTIGHVINYKNPDLWIEVAKAVIKNNPDVKFVWAGDGVDLQTCRDKISGYGLEREIQFIGHHNRVGDLFDDAMIYLQPSLYESHGIAVLEAMSFGIPCIVSNSGGLKESVLDGKTGFIVESLDEYEARINLLLNNSDLRKQMGENARAHFRRTFSHEVWSHKISAVLHEIKLII